ncbi:MAG: hypothetical protein K6E86_03850 [Bacteroidales bacterium]|nr:hypothetical protein [Bacteroidales bacterium]
MNFTSKPFPPHFDPKIIEMLKHDQYIQAIKYVKDKKKDIDLAAAKEEVDHIREELIKNGVNLPEHKAGCASFIILFVVMSATLIVF